MSNSEVRRKEHIALCLTTRSKERITSHLALRLTARSEERKIITSTPPFEEVPFELCQAYLGSTQTLREIEAWSTCQQPFHLC
jgi:hypothetical protein